MTISTRIRGELFLTQPDKQVEQTASLQLIRLPLTRPPGVPTTTKKTKKSSTKKAAVNKIKVKADPSHRHGLPWTTDEHDRFLQGLERYPSGPWKTVAAFVGTRTPRQTMTHAQKYRQKIQRRRRGLLTSSRQPVPPTSDVYCGLMITTKEDAPASPIAGKSPTAVDASQMEPLESNWFEKVQVSELDAAFRAVLEVYDPTLFMEEEQHAYGFHNDYCNVSIDDVASIVL
ncbi:hypothetical protein KRP22_007754 [Phytophthora ramorum]|uniref:Uncharacterized protein n=1 Tax=Phytophthora ramorum TaxID=164328 RepID=H3GUL3_PHYRM|nr:Transcription factor SRM1 [Phytophthora ramorum]